MQLNLSHLVAFNGLVNNVGFGRKKRGMKDLLELEENSMRTTRLFLSEHT